MFKSRFFIYSVDTVTIRCNDELLPKNTEDKEEIDTLNEEDWIDNYSKEIREVLEFNGYDSSEYIDVDFEEDSITFYYLNGETILSAETDSSDIQLPNMSVGEFIKIDSFFADRVVGEVSEIGILREGDIVEILKKVYNLCEGTIDYYIKRFFVSNEETYMLKDDNREDKKIDLYEDDLDKLSGSDALNIE